MNTTNRKHPLVVIEGMDASGKATQSQLLAGWLNGQVVAYPQYTTVTGEAIKGNLEGGWHAAHAGGATPERAINALVLQCLMTVNRYETAPSLLNLLKAAPVVLDRYWASGVVYGQADGLPMEWLLRIHKLLPRPDVWLYLDISPEESVLRRPERRDRYERQAGLMEEVRKKYIALFQGGGDFGEEWHIVNGSGSIGEVHQRIRDVVSACFLRAAKAVH